MIIPAVLSSPFSSLTAAFFASESAERYSSMSFFSAAVTLMLDLEPDEDFAEVVFREELLSLEALIRDACVTPVAFAIPATASFCRARQG